MGFVVWLSGTMKKIQGQFPGIGRAWNLGCLRAGQDEDDTSEIGQAGKRNSIGGFDAEEVFGTDRKSGWSIRALGWGATRVDGISVCQ